jgi:hypothetical protein
MNRIYFIILISAFTFISRYIMTQSSRQLVKVDWSQTFYSFGEKYINVPSQVKFVLDVTDEIFGLEKNSQFH